MLKFSLFDFDRTIYRGFSSIDFWLFFIKKHWTAIFYFPNQIFFAILFLLKIISPENFKIKILVFLKKYTQAEIALLVKEFWQHNYKKINPQIKQALDHDKKEGLIIVCISASYNFILEEVKNELPIAQIIATTYDFKTKNLVGYNCKGENKVKMFQEWVQKEYHILDYHVQRAYTDSKADLPLLKLAQEKYWVKNGKVEKIAEI